MSDLRPRERPSPNGLRIAVLTSRDLVRHGVRGMLAGLPMPVHYTWATDPTWLADLVIVDATGTTEASAEGLEDVTVEELAPVVVLTSRRAPEGFGRWDRPVHTFVTVSATDSELVAAVAEALRVSLLSRTTRALASPPEAHGLSPRETEVLTAIASGRSNEDIAKHLYLGINTVKTYIRTSYRKIGVTTRPNAILWALGHGLGPDGVHSARDDRDIRWTGDDPA
ncbi:response regulator transcription factor [Nocardioides sp. 1609]|uniref:helix-turn-helix transcriptional regulator n=1 Tax=Nocardioides sp. 1609 TaxID=2508327 RepID=UPI001ADCE7B8|nr:response regulator transcription factor [Nocardioides sp. 1609]